MGPIRRSVGHRPTRQQCVPPAGWAIVSAHLGYPPETQAVIGTSGTDAARWSRTQSSFTQPPNRTMIDLSDHDLLQLIGAAKIVERDTAATDSIYDMTRDGLAGIVQEVLSYRLIKKHLWQNPVPMPVEVAFGGELHTPRRVVLRDGRTAVVTKWKVATNHRYSFFKSIVPDGLGDQLLHFSTGTAYRDSARIALDQLESVVYHSDTELYECPTEPTLAEAWTKDSPFFWPRIMSARLTDVMSYEYD